MRIEQLRYFIETANQCSIHKASDKLHISHQSLSTSLKSLEQELGQILLQRDNHGIRLTSAGKLTLLYAQDIVKRTQDFTTMLQNIDNSQEPLLIGNLSCFMSPNVSLYTLPHLINQFTAMYRGVSVSLTELESNLIIKQLLDGKEGLSFISTYKNSSPEFQSYSTLYYQPLYEERNFAVLSNVHPLARYKSISLNTMLQYPLSIYQAADNSSSTLLDYLNKAGSPKVHLLSNNLKVCTEAIVSGQTVGIIPQQAIRRELIFSSTAPVIYLPIKDMSPVVIAYLVNRQYYETNRQIIDLFLKLFRNIW